MGKPTRKGISESSRFHPSASDRRPGRSTATASGRPADSAMTFASARGLSASALEIRTTLRLT